MKISVNTTLDVLKKPSPIEKKNGNGFYYPLMVMTDSDCGTLYVPELVYNVAKEGSKLALSGEFITTKDGSYISWRNGRVAN